MSYTIQLEMDEETGENVIETLRNNGFPVYINRTGDILGRPTKEYKVLNR